MRQGRLVLAGLLAGAVVALAAAPGALGDPNGDYQAIEGDFFAHQGVITHCRFTLQQLNNASVVSQSTPQSAYADNVSGFSSALEGEIRSQQSKPCSGGSLPAGTPTPGSKLSLSVAPKSIRRRHRATFTFTVTGRQGSKKIAVKGARVSFQGFRKTTDSRGRVKIAKLFRSAGTRAAGASYRGVKSATTAVRVRR